VLSEFFAGDRRRLRLDRELASLAPLDRDFARELVLGVLRRRSRLDAEIAGASRFPLDRLRPPLREILEVSLLQMRFLDRVPTRAIVHEAVEMARALAGEGASRLANGILRSLLRAPGPALPEEDAATLAVASSHPEFLVARWIARFGLEKTRAIVAADSERSPLHLLCDPRRRNREEVAADLLGEQVETAPHPLVENGLIVVSGNPLRTAAFEAGAFYVADAGSQALPSLLPPGRTLADLAAAPGGKTAAALFSGRFERVVSADRSTTRLSFLAQNRSRLSLGDAFPVAADLLAPPFREGAFDRVLLDAPCSGTGTLRKNPEIRYRLSAAAIESLAAQELRLLSAAADLVAPGGSLLYSTCSLEKEENEDVAEKFLARASGFRAQPIEAAGPLRARVQGHRFRIFPDEGADGFTAHLFRREGVSRGA